MRVNLKMQIMLTYRIIYLQKLQMLLQHES